MKRRRGLLEKGKGRKKVVEDDVGEEPASRSSFSLRAEEEPPPEPEKGWGDRRALW